MDTEQPAVFASLDELNGLGAELIGQVLVPRPRLHLGHEEVRREIGAGAMYCISDSISSS
jgi:hypothetical protein